MPSRRLALATAALAVAPLVAACSSDGRELRPPRPDQNQSILPADATSSSSAPATTTTLATAATAPAGTGFSMAVPWAPGGAIPAANACTGANKSPTVSWSNLPAGTAEVAVTMIDLDLGGALHWLIAGIDPTQREVVAGALPAGAAQAKNLQGAASYTGPCPPPGTTHRYQVEVWALKNRSGLAPGAEGPVALATLERDRLTSASTVGSFSR